MWGAFATNCPKPSKIAQEKSSLSLILTDEAVFCKVMPICSAIARNKLLKISNITGSGDFRFWISDFRLKLPDSWTLFKIRWFLNVTSACQPGSMTLVPVDSTIIAGPKIESPGCKSGRWKSGVSCQVFPVNIRTVVTGAGDSFIFRSTIASSGISLFPITSTETASTINPFSGKIKP